MVVLELWNGVPALKITPTDPAGRLIGYARVSREEQSEKMQVDALVEAGVPAKSIYKDSASGRTLNRRGVTAALKAAREGDMLVVWRLDRLTRSSRDMANLIDAFRERSVGLYSLTETIDITTPGGRLTAMLFALMAEYEVEVMSTRTKAGQQAGREIGFHPGRPSKTTWEQKLEIIALMKAKPKGTTYKDWRTVVAKRFDIGDVSVVNIVKNGRRGVTKQRREEAQRAKERQR
jgi:DNA invertase Pin-like site-specific DNA recombinase